MAIHIHISLTKDAGFNESDHPRASNGQFGSGGGGGKSGAGKAKSGGSSGEKPKKPALSKEEKIKKYEERGEHYNKQITALEKKLKAGPEKSVGIALKNKIGALEEKMSHWFMKAADLKDFD